MTRVAFVVGGFGFLGQALTTRALGEGWRIGIVDPRAPSEGEVSLGGPGSTVHAVRSVVSKEACARLAQALGAPTHVFHLGGSGSVGDAERDPAHDRALTVDSAQLLADLARAHRARLVLVSSAAVYGGGATEAISESLPRAPISTYGRHKAEAEDVVASAGVSSAIVRLFSVYGPGLRKQLLWDACQKLRRSEGRFGGTGEELRDWLHVDDAIALLLLAAVATEPSLLVNGGTGVGTSVAGVLGCLREALGAGVPLSFSGEARAGDPRALVAEIARARALGWAPRHAILDGIRAYARWFEAQAC